MRSISNSPELAKSVLKQLLEAGIIINRTHEKVLRFLPPYIIQKKHVDELIAALDRALSAGIDEPSESGKSGRVKKNTVLKPERNSVRTATRTRQKEAADAHA